MKENNKEQVDISLDSQAFYKRYGRKKIVCTLTLGCKVNQYETQGMEDIFLKKGYKIVDEDEIADVYVINTCTVTHISDRKSRQFMRRAKKLNENSILVVAGCYSQVSPNEVAKIEEVDIVIGTKDRNKIVNLVENFQRGSKIINVFDISKTNYFEEMQVNQIRGKTRAFVKIQDGCNSFCSYCIIPYARGRIRSREIENIEKEVKSIVESGVKEIVLTGINVASYGKDGYKYSLLDVIKRLDNIDGLERIRTSSIEPDIMQEDFVEELSKIKKLCPHFHLSIQSCSDSVLKRMNRKYNAIEIPKAVKTLKKYMPQVAITTDIIVGFPGETDEEFKETYDMLSDLKLYHMHVFKYSNREGTRASKMLDQISDDKKNKRSELLIELSLKNEIDFLKNMVGTKQRVLFEQKISEGVYEGLTDNYIRVWVKTFANLEGQIKTIEITKINENHLEGIIL